MAGYPVAGTFEHYTRDKGDDCTYEEDDYRARRADPLLA
jgi:hypothetical protein